MTIHHPHGATETRVFDWPRDAWAAVQALVETLKADGFVAGEVEMLRYGEAWIQQLTHPDRGSCAIVVEAETA